MINPKRTVVLIDDSATVHALFKRSLKDIEIELITYKLADEAVQYLRENKPDLLFLDIIMPDKDGLTFLQELRKIPLHHNTRVIIITSKDYAQDRIIAERLGAMEFIVKPTQMRTIKDTILRYIK